MESHVFGTDNANNSAVCRCVAILCHILNMLCYKHNTERKMFFDWILFDFTDPEHSGDRTDHRLRPNVTVNV